MNHEEKNNRRKQPRYNCVSKIRYTVSPEPAEDEREGVMLNMSSAGLCLEVKGPIEVGQEISITQCVASFCCRKYKVQWIMMSDEKFETYTAGLMSPEYNLYR